MVVGQRWSDLSLRLDLELEPDDRFCRIAVAITSTLRGQGFSIQSEGLALKQPQPRSQ